MILGNLIVITQTSMQRMLAYPSIGQIRYVIIGNYCRLKWWICKHDNLL